MIGWVLMSFDNDMCGPPTEVIDTERISVDQTILLSSRYVLNFVDIVAEGFSKLF